MLNQFLGVHPLRSGFQIWVVQRYFRIQECITFVIVNQMPINSALNVHISFHSSVLPRSALVSRHNRISRWLDPQWPMVRSFAAKRLSRKIAEVALAGLMSRVHEINGSPKYLYSVRSVVVFRMASLTTMVPAASLTTSKPHAAAARSRASRTSISA